MKTHWLSKSFIFMLGICISTTALSQSDTLSGIPKLRQLIKDQQIVAAQQELSRQIETFKQQQNYDTLVRYIEFVGSFSLSGNNKKKAINKAEAFIEMLEQLKDPYINKESLLELAWIYNDAGDPSKSYELLEEAKQIALTIHDPKRAGIANIEYKLGYHASIIGNYVLSKKHYKKALQLLEQEQSADHVFFQQTYNALGGVMYFTGKLDSANYYFKKAIAVLKKTDPKDLMNQYYRPGLVSMNIAVISNALGNNFEAIRYSQEALNNFETFIKNSKDEQRILQAQRNRLSTIENLGAFYNAIGEIKRSEQIISKAYEEKKKILDPNDPNMAISLIVLAQANMALQDFEKAGTLLDKALLITEANPGVQLYWKASALTTRASVYQKMGDVEKAKALYQKSEALYRKSLGDEYSTDFLTELNKMSQFYAENDTSQKALSLAEEAYQFGKKSDFKNTLQDFNYTLNLASVHFKLKNYEEALAFSNNALSLDYGLQGGKSSLGDSIQLQYHKPLALLTHAKAQYALANSKNDALLKNLSQQIEEGLNILEQRKSIIKSYDELNLLITENKELFDFAKKLKIDLYQKSNDSQYLIDLLTLHESAIYSRIRSRLNLRNNLAFSNLPKKIMVREQNLKEQLSKSISGDSSLGLENFFKINVEWETFLDSLQIQYPKYYEMRYASLKEPMTHFQKNIPENATVIRYLFVDQHLFALIATATRIHLIPLDFEKIAHLLHPEAQLVFDIEKLAPKLQMLYSALWQPFEEKVTTSKVIIVPDEVLFNISFETLTPHTITSFKDLATQSLLARHAISYQFSLLQLSTNVKKQAYPEDFIAFAPEFSETMKSNYMLALKDSSQIDRTYLTLLPQPFSLDLAKEYTKVFHGSSYLNEDAVKPIFTQEAKEHKIIHIGTHAESNNLSPELSRLVFAKNILPNNHLEDNYLYSYEIYNYNLSSNLTLLTACETGKPTYQSGEGMISLAHAFTYAGSESILTSLWKIDEKSSTEIVGYFYENLKKGLDKDEALQQAKLQYLSHAEGRTVSPSYWAGMVLMGDTSPLPLGQTSTIWYWVLGILAAIIFLAIIFWKKLSRVHFFF